MKNYVISVDLGGTKILSSLIDEENNIIEREKTPTSIQKGGKGIVNSIVESITALKTRSEIDDDMIKGVCLGVPGIINPFEGIIYNAPNLKINDYNIKEEFGKMCELPIYLENDVNLGALGIKRKEYNNQVNNMFVVFVGTGIGAAIILNGKLYRGSTFFAGEAGHMFLNARKNERSGSLTLESFASRTAIVDRITADIKEGKKSVLKNFVESGKRIKSKALANALAEKDKVTCEHIDSACEVIGNMLGNVQTLMNFDSFVLGGGVIEAMGDYMLPKIRKSFHQTVYDTMGEGVTIQPTLMGDDAALYGGWEVINEGYELNIK